MRTDGELPLSAGTLYRSIQRMLEQGLIVETRAGRRRMTMTSGGATTGLRRSARRGEGRDAAADAAREDGAGEGFKPGDGVTCASTACCCASTPRRSATSTARRCAPVRRRRREAPGRSPGGALAGGVADVIPKPRCVHCGPAEAGPALHRPHAAPDAGLRHHRRAGRGARHRRDDRRLLGHRLRPDPAAAVSASRIVWSRSGSERPATPGSSCRRRTIATGRRQHGLREHRDVPPRRSRTCRRRRAAAGRAARPSRSICSDAPACAAHRPAVHRGGRSRAAQPAGALQPSPLADANSAATRASSDSRCMLDNEPHTVIGVMPRGVPVPDRARRSSGRRSGSPRRTIADRERQLSERRRPPACRA